MRGKVGGGDALGLHADLKGCRVQLGGSCRKRPGNVERKERKSRSLWNVWCSRAHSLHGRASGEGGTGRRPSAKRVEGVINS